jgi:hypothetical protein
MPQRRSRKGKKKNRSGRRADGVMVGGPRIMKWNASGGRSVAPLFETTLRFEKHVSFSQNTIASTSVRYKPTFAYDIDPNLGSTAMPFFTEYTAMYGGYRVLWYSADITFANQEAFDVTAYALTVAADPGANVSVAVAQSFLSNLKAKKCQLGRATTPNRGRIRVSDSVARYSGQAWPKIFDPYSGAGTTTPQDILYFHVGAVPTNGTSTFTTSTGVAISISINVRIAFFTMTNPSALLLCELVKEQREKRESIPARMDRLTKEASVNQYHFDRDLAKSGAVKNLDLVGSKI